MANKIEKIKQDLKSCDLKVVREQNFEASNPTAASTSRITQIDVVFQISENDKNNSDKSLTSTMRSNLTYNLKNSYGNDVIVNFITITSKENTTTRLVIDTERKSTQAFSPTGP